MTRPQMVEAFDSQKGNYGIRRDTHTVSFADNTIYDDGNPDEKQTWQVRIVGEITDESRNAESPKQEGKVSEKNWRLRALIRSLKEKGLELFSGARGFLASHMSDFAREQRPLGALDSMVLNGNIIDKDANSPICYATWQNGQLLLANNDSDFGLRVFGSVTVV